MMYLLKSVSILFLLIHVSSGLLCYTCFECPYTNSTTEINYRTLEGGAEWVNFTSCTALTITDNTGGVKVYRDGDLMHSKPDSGTNWYYCITDLCNGNTRGVAVGIAAPSLFMMVLLMAINTLCSHN